MKGPSAMPSLSWHSWAAASGGSSWRKGCSSTLWVTEPARTPFCSRPSAARSAAPGQSALYNGPGGYSVTLCTASLRLHWREPSPIHFTHPGQMEPDQATGSYDVGSKLSTSAGCTARVRSLGSRGGATAFRAEVLQSPAALRRHERAKVQKGRALSSSFSTVSWRHD